MNTTIENQRMLCDLHTHPSCDGGDEGILRMLCSDGLVGLAHINDGRTWVLTYEKVLTRFEGRVTEIDKGMFARIQTDFGTGYVVRVQEIVGGPIHVLALGFEGDYLPNDYDDVKELIRTIHARGGTVVLCHPYLTQEPGALHRLITPREEDELQRLLGSDREQERPDEIEIFNAHNINAWLWKHSNRNPVLRRFAPNLNHANERSEALAQRFGYKGTVSSDAHILLDQVKICGIHVEPGTLTMKKLQRCIRSGAFDNSLRTYVSKSSFFAGFGASIIKTYF